ncbi:hypothetical protein SteCoe_21663 [Stentor coeruleus]|uniref:Uncharacterized protein n=1 Tax=Stentor coeruleus TaxID=5963 RepID=A0A1R2BNV9_9CILI|nr:hypothetical protein SteCoe_21663 [Stentor coeruleus]
MNKYQDIEIRNTVSHMVLPPLHTAKNSYISLFQKEDLGFVTPKSKLTIKDFHKISELSVEENSKFQPKSDRILYSNTSEKRDVSEFFLGAPNFDGLIQSLDRISKKNSEIREKELKEGESSSMSLKKDSYLFFKVRVKDKKPPLKVSIKRSVGIIKVFVSKKRLASDEFHDYVFSIDTFEVGDKNTIFSIDYIYLSAFGVTDSEFTAYLKFGKIKHTLIESRSMQKMVTIEEYDNHTQKEDFRAKLNKRVESIMKIRKMKLMQLAKSKNFIKMNKNSSQSIISKDTIKWEERKEIVFQRKNQNFADKLQRAKDLINKKILKQEFELLKNEEEKKRQNSLCFQKAWISIVSFWRSYECLKKKFKEAKEKKMLNIKTSLAARVIQKKFKMFSKNLPQKDQILLRARNCLIYFHNNKFKIEERMIKKDLLEVIKTSNFYMQVYRKFRGYIIKVSLIQRKLKMFVIKIKRRKNEIVKAWNKVLSKLIMENTSSKTNSKYAKVTSHMRDPIISRYYMSKSREFLKKIRLFLTSYKLIKKTGVKMHAKIIPPEFEYMPTDNELKKLIESAMVSKN